VQTSTLGDMIAVEKSPKQSYAAWELANP